MHIHFSESTDGHAQNDDHDQEGNAIQRGPDAGIQAPDEHLVQWVEGPGFPECPNCHLSATRNLREHLKTDKCRRDGEQWRREHGEQ
ncbi:unnamed protein product [Caenorhabditis brenneri]